MPDSAEVVVVGAGFAGAATAYHLAERGIRDVLVLEREARPGVHASGRNAALAFHLMESIDEARLAIEGTERWRDPPPELADRPLLDPVGSLHLADHADDPALAADERDARSLGLATERLDRSEIVRRVPVLEGSPATSGVFNPADGVVDIARLLGGYLRGATSRGLRLRTGAPVTEVETTGGRVEAIHVGPERIATRALVVAAGGWAGELGSLAGVGSRTLAPFRRHLYEIEPSRAVDPRWPFVWHAGDDVYFRPEAGGLLASACDKTASPPGDPPIDPAAAGELARKMARAFPGLVPFRIRAARACLRTFTADGRFLLGADPELEGLFWAAGLGGHGMSTSWGVGRIVAASLLGTPPPGVFAASRDAITGRDGARRRTRP